VCPYKRIRRIKTEAEDKERRKETDRVSAISVTLHTKRERVVVSGLAVGG
jgi:hypothetical protein